MSDQPTKKLDETVPGGRYIVGGRVVDANGKPMEGEQPEQQPTQDERAVAEQPDAPVVPRRVAGK